MKRKNHIGKFEIGSETAEKHSIFSGKAFLIAALTLLFAAMSFEIQAQKTKPQTAENFIYHQRLIFIKMRLNRREDMLFLLDTGANRSAIDSSVAERFKLPSAGTDKVEGTAGVIETTKAKIDSLSFEKAEVKNLTVTVQNLSGITAPPNEKVAGILGYDFLRYFAVEINFPERRIKFSRRAAKSAEKSGAASLSFTLDNGIPRIEAVLNESVETGFRLDTGASIFETKDVYLNVTEDVWNRLKAENPTLKPQKYFTGSGIGGEIKLPVARIKSFSTGSLHVPNPFVIVQPKAGYFARPDAVGFISNNLLEKYSRVTIDYLEKKIYLNRADE
jgi:Retroviral aspartyl protease.